MILFTSLNGHKMEIVENSTLAIKMKKIYLITSEGLILFTSLSGHKMEIVENRTLAIKMKKIYLISISIGR